MVRKSLDAEAAYADVVIQGNGMRGLSDGANSAKAPTHFDLPFAVQEF